MQIWQNAELKALGFRRDDAGIARLPEPRRPLRDLFTDSVLEIKWRWRGLSVSEKRDGKGEQNDRSNDRHHLIP